MTGSSDNRSDHIHVFGIAMAQGSIHIRAVSTGIEMKANLCVFVFGKAA